MGIDWFSMRLKPNVDIDEVRDLVETQRTSFQKAGYSYSNWIPKYDSEFEHSVDEPKQQYLNSSKALKSYLNIDRWTEGEKTGVCFRVFPITGYDVFPIEWQQQAYRTILPSELPAQLTIWREHIAAIQQGKYQTYFKYRFLYETSLELFQDWDELRSLADESLSRTNNWARKPAFVELRNQLLELPPPEIYPAPLWSYWCALPNQVDERVDGHYLKQQRYLLSFWQLNKKWNSRAPKNRKRPYYHCDNLPAFETFISMADDSWLHEFFGWAETCCQEGKGLFLDY
jgi:hypothetical protein